MPRAQPSSDLDVVLVGAGGHAHVVADMLAALGRRLRGYVAPIGSTVLKGTEWLGTDDVLREMTPGTADLVVGVGSAGDVAVRRAIFDLLDGQGHCLPALVHPTGVLARDVTLGAGAQVMLGAAVQAGVTVGRNAIINTGAVVDHDCRIGDHAHVAPGAVLCGDVTVGEAAHVGAGARVIQGVRIGGGALVAAGAVVISDVPDGARVAGVPAKEMRG